MTYVRDTRFGIFTSSFSVRFNWDCVLKCKSVAREGHFLYSARSETTGEWQASDAAWALADDELRPKILIASFSCRKLRKPRRDICAHLIFLSGQQFFASRLTFSTIYSRHSQNIPRIIGCSLVRHRTREFNSFPFDFQRSIFIYLHDKINDDASTFIFRSRSVDFNTIIACWTTPRFPQFTPPPQFAARRRTFCFRTGHAWVLFINWTPRFAHSPKPTAVFIVPRLLPRRERPMPTHRNHLYWPNTSCDIQ